MCFDQKLIDIVEPIDFGVGTQTFFSDFLTFQFPSKVQN